MKIIILGMMLVMGSLSFSKDKGRDKENFDDLKFRAESSRGQQQQENKEIPVGISNIFNL